MFLGDDEEMTGEEKRTTDTQTPFLLAFFLYAYHAKCPWEVLKITKQQASKIEDRML
jgi:hypothetical protein